MGERVQAAGRTSTQPPAATARFVLRQSCGCVSRGETNCPACRREAAPNSLAAPPAEARSGHDFGRMRVHADASAAGPDRIVGRQEPPSGPGANGPNAAEAAPGQAAPAGQPAQMAQGGPGSSVSIPTCKATAVANWIADPQAKKTRLFGLTTMNLTNAVFPEFKVEPAAGGKGVKVKPATASLPPIDMQFLAPKAEGYEDKDRPQWQCNIDSDPWCDRPRWIKPKVLWKVDDAGSKALARGEQEHCDDFRLAFFFLIGGITNIINRLAGSGQTFADEAAAKRELQKDVKLDPKDFRKYFQCVAQATVDERDDPPRSWHTPMDPTSKAVRKVLRPRKDTSTGDEVVDVPIITKIGQPTTVDVVFNRAPLKCGHLMLGQPGQTGGGTP